MSLKKVQELRKSKLFRPADILLFGVLLLMIVILFVALFFRDRGEISGIEIFYREECIFTYEGGDYRITAGYEDHVIVEEGESLLITVYTEDGSGYNEIVIEKSGKSYVREANCSAHKDCVYTPAVEHTGDVIVCVPHHLKICALGQSDVPQNPVIG